MSENYISEAEALNDVYDEENVHFLSGNAEEGGEFVLFPNRLREEVRNAMFDLQTDRAVAQQDTRTLDQVIADMRARYVKAKAAKVGTEIECACCGKKVIKTSYQMAFCSNGKNRKNALLGNNNCKDRYWNLTDDKRRGHAIRMGFGESKQH
jgi:hypothetical protein